VMNLKQDCGRVVAFLNPNATRGQFNFVARDFFRPIAAGYRTDFETLMLRWGDAAGDLVFARRLALFDGVTLVDSAGEAIDKPSGLVGWALKPNVSRPNRSYEGRKQNARADDRCANDHIRR
jgi:hypothetical protein